MSGGSSSRSSSSVMWPFFLPKATTAFWIFSTSTERFLPDIRCWDLSASGLDQVRANSKSSVGAWAALERGGDGLLALAGADSLERQFVHLRVVAGAASVVDLAVEGRDLALQVFALAGLDVS